MRRLASAWTATGRELAWVWLALLLVGFGTCHVLASLHWTDFGIDGGYYAAVAVKVRDGFGLETNVSILHKGDVTFPAPTSVYPLWPLVFGYLSRIFPLNALAVWAPAALYMAALIFSYLWVQRTHPREFFPHRLPGFQAAHVMVIVLGLSSFFTATLKPQTEPLAYALMFAAFWRFTKLWVAPSWQAGVEMGAWVGLVLLTRPQLVVSAGVAFLLLAYAALVCRGLRARYAQMLVTSAITFVAVAAPWFLYTWSFAPDASVGQVLAFASVRPNHILSSLQGLRPALSLKSWLLDRLSGFPVAYAWASKRSYFVQYFTFHYAALFTLPFALGACIGRLVRGGFAEMRAWLVDPANLPCLYALGYGTAAFLALHVMHTTDWYFHRRHGLGSVVFVAAMVVGLFSFKNVIPKLVGIAILASGVWYGGQQLALDTERAFQSKPWRPAPVVTWIQKRARKEPGLVIAMRHPQAIGYRLPNVGFHWFTLETTTMDFERMVTELGVDYVTVPSALQAWWLSRGKRFEYVRRVGDDILYRPNQELRARVSERVASGPSASTTAIALKR